MEAKRKSSIREGYTGVFIMNTALFKGLCQPDLYWTFSGLAESAERDETEYYMNTKEPDQPKGQYLVDTDKLLDAMTGRWIDLWNTHVKDVLPGVQGRSMGHWSPKYYNYGGDSGDFEVKLSCRAYNRICKQAMADPAFAGFLKSKYSSYDGFISFYPDCLPDYIKEFNGHGSYNKMTSYGRALVVAIAFLVFRGKEHDFSQEYEYDIYEDLEITSDMMYFEPETRWYDDPGMRGKVCADCGASPGGNHCAMWTSVSDTEYVCRDCAEKRSAKKTA